MSEQGSFNHLLSIDDLPLETLQALLNKAQYILDHKLYTHQQSTQLADKTIATLFFESSTRTRLSFTLAARRLGAEVINLDEKHAATQKGESVLDTMLTLQAMNCQYFVIRQSVNGIVEQMAKQLGSSASVINAGDGMHAHPSQALLDLLTILQSKPDLSQLKVAIVGDIRHSRVANSQIAAFLKIGVNELRLIGPQAFLPTQSPPHVVQSTELESGLQDVDVIITLRLQKERISQTQWVDEAAYHQQFGLNNQRLALAKPDAILLHPGPIQRGVELTAEVADGEQSRILDQVRCGIAMRMAIFNLLRN